MAGSNAQNGPTDDKAVADQSALLKKAFAGVLESAFGGQQGLKLNGIVISVEDKSYTDPETKKVSNSRVASVTDGSNNFVFKAYEDNAPLPDITAMSPISIEVEYCKTNAGVITLFGKVV